MKAVITRNPGRDSSLEIEQRPDPIPGSGQIRVAVEASAINRADLLQRMGRYAAPAGAAPDICGLEYAGRVDQVGDGVSLWRAGDRVMGIIAGGAHSEFVVVHEREALPVPDELDLREAAAIPEVFLTAYDALFPQLGLGIGQTLLIHAAGSGVGTAGIQLARMAGAKTIGTSRTASKLERARELGLNHAVVADDDQWPDRVLEIAAEGVQTVMDLVGGDYLQGDLRCVARQGRILVVGLVAGVRTSIDLSLLLNRRVWVGGTVLRARPLEEKISLAQKFLTDAIPGFRQGKLRPVIDAVLPITEADQGYRLMSSNKTYGKIVIHW